ncbi:efflux transporter outer membrane subunit [Phaeovulum vinaykumarii]|uniref:Outer membrane protein, multidrug efflux system n=1 Tax=Phaeovulum vinaykumarii TaxID=407234 RepID=A0A1N7L9B9_9RHOB|nr:efflux transporter outer membrane subunit [Phaeovulum vinaykumarii]SIS70426.1 outer membrane protein, multidrug efflux system [Phaeovulum vinaykumarii]SOB98914.1 multidrug efflux system outer membrane protein [Phaeovulum vinaykumarii]
MKPVLLLSALVLAGCAVGPDFRRPEVALETRFVGGDAASIGAVARQAWWQDYRDPVLSDLVARGLAQGLDVMAASERLREAEANLRATGDSALSGSLAAAQTRAGGDGLVNTDTASASLGAAYVLDLFGGVRRAREGARADVVSARAAEETTRLAFLAELVAAYSDARYYQEALALSRQTIAARAETVEITRRQFAAGAATEYELAQAEALLQTARADLPQYAAQFDARVFAIATLLAEPAGPLRTRLQRGAPQLRIPGGSRTGVPADLLRNRPDVRGAEADLASAVAAVGVAEADLYPALTLSGTLARANGADTWSFGPGLSLPVLSQGSLRGARDAAVSRARQAEIDWRAAILAAVEDVTVARSNLDRYRQRAAALRRAADSYDRALKLAQANYRNGAITLLDLLETDRSAASARIAAASGVNEAAKAWASLRIATGAGAAVAAGG